MKIQFLSAIALIAAAHAARSSTTDTTGLGTAGTLRERRLGSGLVLPPIDVSCIGVYDVVFTPPAAADGHGALGTGITDANVNTLLAAADGHGRRTTPPAVTDGQPSITPSALSRDLPPASVGGSELFGTPLSSPQAAEIAAERQRNIEYNIIENHFANPPLLSASERLIEEERLRIEADRVQRERVEALSEQLQADKNARIERAIAEIMAGEGTEEEKISRIRVVTEQLTTEIDKEISDRMFEEQVPLSWDLVPDYAEAFTTTERPYLLTRAYRSMLRKMGRLATNPTVVDPLNYYKGRAVDMSVTAGTYVLEQGMSKAGDAAGYTGNVVKCALTTSKDVVCEYGKLAANGAVTWTGRKLIDAGAWMTGEPLAAMSGGDHELDTISEEPAAEGAGAAVDSALVSHAGDDASGPLPRGAPLGSIASVIAIRDSA